MPGSAIEGKNLVRDFIAENNLRTFFDVGAGEGTYYNVLNGLSFYADLAPVAYDRLDGVEVWGPYIAEYGLWSRYNEIIVADAYMMDWSRLPADRYDMVFLGDVIEHMPRWKGLSVIRRAAMVADYLVVTLPIYGYAQDVGYEGNWHETHVEQYSDKTIKDALSDYEILVEHQGSIVGTYIVRTNRG
jgi:hypothetical protein